MLSGDVPSVVNAVGSVDEVFAHLRPGSYHDIEHMKILIRHDLDGPGIVNP